MPEKRKKVKSPLWWLIGFPIVDVISVLIFILGTILDSKLYENATGPGHPVPVFTLLLSFGAVGFFIIGNVIVLIMLIISLVITSKKKKAQQDLV